MTYLPARKLYQEWAATYDDPSNPLIEAESKVLAGILGEVAGKKVLDLGCGTGRHAILLAKAGAQVTGVDFSDEMLAVARSNSKGLEITFLNAELGAVPLEEPFDLVLCSLVLSHVPDLLPAMKEMSRLTRPGGRIIITDLRTDHWFRKTRKIRKFGNYVTDGFKHTLSDYRTAAAATWLKLECLSRIYFDDAIVARFRWFFYLKYIAVGYAFELTKQPA
ncbi:MAG: methyltransferase domain-containing protein [Prosthecobacter sp.]|uniref:class I SAM-dependent methyltransferase n=1 Tax=Prosthecobacter sp. TaxID=1965333 RepID=UPI0025D36B0B|nr:class I SAM-dependent methyltransferase [Prosthecobacter sp.]MCF7785809.1 methyltransferase domain-containing protein [Prosthecobacter sp.]